LLRHCECWRRYPGGSGGVTESNSFTLPELCAAVPLPPAHPTPAALLAHVRAQLHAVVADLFTAARSRAAAAVGFFPLAGSPLLPERMHRVYPHSQYAFGTSQDEYNCVLMRGGVKLSSSAPAQTRPNISRTAVRLCVSTYSPANTFELFGLDFLLDGSGKAWVLEVNADPSLAVFGDRLRPQCAELIRDTLDAALPSVVGGGDTGDVVSGGDGKDGGGGAYVGSRHGQTVRSSDGGDSSVGDIGHAEQDVGGFRLVRALPPRFPNGAEGRRRASTLMSLMGSLAVSTYGDNDGDDVGRPNAGGGEARGGAGAAGGAQMASVSLVRLVATQLNHRARAALIAHCPEVTQP
jgi:hypothetical protein